VAQAAGRGASPSGHRAGRCLSLVLSILHPADGCWVMCSSADWTTATVREWCAERIRCGVSKTMIAKSYRQLRAILNTAVVEHDPNGSRLPRSGADLPTQQSGV
jgi:hypothetical protein